jgi:L-serine dehydratase
LSEVIRNALAVMEVNGSMGRIVACPTAGSAGTTPAAVITLAEKHSVPEEKVVKALFTGAGIGIIVAQNASISGAVGGCQAETGTASALTAAVLTEMFGGNCSMILNSVALALGNILGIVCDPVAGMVEIPCIQRNVMAAANAITSAEMALAGVESIIPADEVISAMDEVGKLMPVSLKDTLGAGISNTPTARKIQSQISKDRKQE